MKIAIPYDQGKVFQHFGKTEQFKVYIVEDQAVVSSELRAHNGQGHGALAGLLQEWGVTTIICGGIGAGARQALAEANITLYPGVEGDCDEAVQALLAGNLVFNPAVECSHHGHGHSHEHEHGHEHGKGHRHHHE